MQDSIRDAINNVRIGVKSIKTSEHRKNTALLYDTYRTIIGADAYNMVCTATYPELPTIMMGTRTIHSDGTFIDEHKDYTTKVFPVFIDAGVIVSHDKASDDSMTYLVRVIVQRGYTLYGSTIIRTSPTSIEFRALVSNDDTKEEFHLPTTFVTV